MRVNKKMLERSMEVVSFLLLFYFDDDGKSNHHFKIIMATQKEKRRMYFLFSRNTPRPLWFRSTVQIGL